MGIKKLISYFENGNVSVAGIKGSGKDVLFGNVIARIPRPYISNVDYTQDDRYHPLDLNAFNVNNTFENFISGEINKYEYPYPDNMNVYISDAGNYFPSQYNSQLDKKYGYIATWASLQRQLGNSSLSSNSQAHERVWIKLREQCNDHYLRCRKCKIIFGIVILQYTYYDKESSFIDRVKPFRLRLPLFANRDQKLQFDIYKDKHYNTYGTVRNETLICINKSKHNTRIFKEMLKNGKLLT